MQLEAAAGAGGQGKGWSEEQERSCFSARACTLLDAGQRAVCLQRREARGAYLSRLATPPARAARSVSSAQADVVRRRGVEGEAVSRRSSPSQHSAPRMRITVAFAPPSAPLATRRGGSGLQVELAGAMLGALLAGAAQRPRGAPQPQGASSVQDGARLAACLVRMPEQARTALGTTRLISRCVLQRA